MGDHLSLVELEKVGIFWKKWAFLLLHFIFYYFHNFFLPLLRLSVIRRNILKSTPLEPIRNIHESCPLFDHYVVAFMTIRVIFFSYACKLFSLINIVGIRTNDGLQGLPGTIWPQKFLNVLHTC